MLTARRGEEVVVEADALAPELVDHSRRDLPAVRGIPNLSDDLRDSHDHVCLIWLKRGSERGHRGISRLAKGAVDY